MFAPPAGVDGPAAGGAAGDGAVAVVVTGAVAAGVLAEVEDDCDEFEELPLEEPDDPRCTPLSLTEMHSFEVMKPSLFRSN